MSAIADSLLSEYLSMSRCKDNQHNVNINKLKQHNKLKLLNLILQIDSSKNTNFRTQCAEYGMNYSLSN